MARSPWLALLGFVKESSSKHDMVVTAAPAPVLPRPLVVDRRRVVRDCTRLSCGGCLSTFDPDGRDEGENQHTSPTDKRVLSCRTLSGCCNSLLMSDFAIQDTLGIDFDSPPSSLARVDAGRVLPSVYLASAASAAGVLGTRRGGMSIPRAILSTI